MSASLMGQLAFIQTLSLSYLFLIGLLAYCCLVYKLGLVTCEVTKAVKVVL